MKLFKERLLTDAQLKKLGEHKYSCQSVSICDSLLQPYWNWLCSKTPIWLAPNLITTLGLIINIITALILVAYSPDAKQEAPKWTCALCALGLFLYQSLDAIDGKQARRTGSANPLGELFDHGCDSISTVFVAITACSAIQLGYYPEWMFFQCFCAMTLFYCAHWQTYVSGTLRFGKVDVTEAQITIMIILTISAICGPSIWSTKIFSDVFYLWYFVPLSTLICGLWALYRSLIVIFTGGVGRNGSTVAVLGLNFSLANAMCVVFYVGYLTVFRAFKENMKKGGKGKNGSTVAIPGLAMEVKLILIGLACAIAVLLAHANVSVIFTGGVGKNGSTVAGTSVLSPVFPLLSVLLPAFVIQKKSKTLIYQNHPVLYILTFGLVSAKVTNRLVVAHMTKSEMAMCDTVLIGPLMLFLNQYFDCFIDEYIVLWMALVWVSLDLSIYCSRICMEICKYLRVELFRIPYPGGPQKVQVSPPGEKNGSSDKNHITSEEDTKHPLLLEKDGDI